LNSKFKEGVVKREDMFITSKLWSNFHRPDLVRGALETSLNRLNTPYLDLYLMHWPFALKEGGELFPKDDKENVLYSDVDFVDTWKEMEKAVDDGLVKSIGVSNFNKSQIEKLLSNCRILPVVNQIECHPHLTQKKLSVYCKSKGIAVTAYSPLSKGFAITSYKPVGSVSRSWDVKEDVVLLADPKILALANKYNKSAAQILIRYQIQRGHSVVPKSVTKSRITSNLDVFDFSLTDDEMILIDSFDCNGRVVVMANCKTHPDWPFNDEY